MYRALRRRGFDKTAAARISNARTPGHRVKANWGARAGQTIVGGLARGSDGKFTSSGQPSARSTQSARGADRRAARQSRADARATAREEALRQEDATRAEEDAYVNAGKTGRERQARRREVAAKRRERAAARREAQRQAQEQERAARAAEDAAEAEARAAEKPKGGGGGGGKQKPSDEQRQAEQARKRAETAARTAQQTSGAARITPQEVDALRRAATGGRVSEAEVDGLVERGLVIVTGNDQFEASDQGRSALSALERGNLSSYQAALQNARNRLTREASARERQAAQAQRAQQRATAAEARRQATEQRRREAEARRAARDAERQANERERLRIADLRARRGVTVAKGLQVFKDAGGRWRWLAVSSTAYRDKDGEIVSRQALASAVQAGDTSGYRGPLRFWHVPGVDLGDCDYQATAHDGRYLIESGTFRTPQFAAMGLKAARRQYQMSIGFVHPADQPDAAGVFTDIGIFERSLVPPGRAANPFTRLTVEERTVDETKKQEFKALGGDAALLDQMLTTTAKDDAQAQAAAVAFKDAPEWAQAILARLEALEATTKAAGDMPPAEMVEAGETEALDGMAEEAIEEPMDDGRVYVGDMDPVEYWQQMDERVARIEAKLDFDKKMSAAISELKAMFAPVAAKDDARAQEIATLKAQQAALDARLKELEGEQPKAASGAGIPVAADFAAQLKATPDGWNPNDPIGGFVSALGLNGAAR